MLGRVGSDLCYALPVSCGGGHQSPHDDRIGRLLDALDDRPAGLWGKLTARAVRAYPCDLSKLHAVMLPIKCTGLCADQPAEDTLSRLEPGYHPEGEWVRQRKSCTRAARDTGVPEGEWVR